MLDLRPIKARLEAATPGPWKAIPWYGFPQEVSPVAEVSMIGVFSDCPVSGSPAKDADLIANAPADLTALVAEVERLRGLLDEHRMADRLNTSEVIE